ncbi:MAG TPA: asparagine--tRNA ligase, partial [Syntrophobacteraceae bacterium]|nr:asparagine--tRNA ligase [Syntrophobacteraceae bacterium]
FWMVEPEMAFCDLQGDMELAEVFIKTIIQAILNDCAADLDFFSRFIDSSILATISQVAHDPFEILTYSEAVKILKTSG